MDTLEEKQINTIIGIEKKAENRIIENRKQEEKKLEKKSRAKRR